MRRLDPIKKPEQLRRNISKNNFIDTKQTRNLNAINNKIGARHQMPPILPPIKPPYKVGTDPIKELSGPIQINEKSHLRIPTADLNV